jgi:hypothetical protein
MINHEVTKALAAERQNDLSRSAAVARLARRVRRTRHQVGHAPDTDIGSFVVHPASSAHTTTDHVLVA